MRTQIIDSWPQLEPLASSWDELAGPVPFRQKSWLGNWWREYGAGYELFVLVVADGDGQVVGLAPWHVEDRGARGRGIRPLGSGEVCSEYVTLLARPGCEEAVGHAVGDWLLAADGGGASPAGRWDWIELANAPVDDVALATLCQRMTAGGCTAHKLPGLACWRAPLPATWEDYIATLSRSNRRRMRDSQKRLQQPDAAVRTATAENFEEAWRLLVDLHQQRWTSQGEKGCFASEAFSRFLKGAAAEFLARGTLRLLWVEIEGRPAACMIALCAGGVHYVYQTGMATALRDESPGWLLQSAALRMAIEAGCHTYDLLRGDEPYKAQLGAQPRATADVRIVSRRLAPQLRHRAWLTGNLVKSAIKSSLSASGLLSATGMCQ